MKTFIVALGIYDGNEYHLFLEKTDATTKLDALNDVICTIKKLQGLEELKTIECDPGLDPDDIKDIVNIVFEASQQHDIQMDVNIKSVDELWSSKS